MIEQTIELLPIQICEALLAHDYFTAYNLKRKKIEIEAFLRMNGNESKYSDDK